MVNNRLIFCGRVSLRPQPLGSCLAHRPRHAPYLEPASTRFPSTLVVFWCGQDFTQQVEYSRQEMRVPRLARCELPQVHVHVHSRPLQCRPFKDSGSRWLIPSMSEFPSREHSKRLGGVAQHCGTAAYVVALKATEGGAFDKKGGGHEGMFPV